jgi:hypothetical protein
MVFLSDLLPFSLTLLAVEVHKGLERAKDGEEHVA